MKNYTSITYQLWFYKIAIAHIYQKLHIYVILYLGYPKGKMVSKTSYSNMKCLLLDAALVLSVALDIVVGDQKNGEYCNIY